MALIFGIVYFAYPRYAAHRDEDFNHSVNDLIDARLKPLQDKLDRMSDDLADVKGKLQVLEPVVQELISRKISESVRAPEKDFLASLPSLGNAVRTGIDARVQVDPAIVSQAARRAVEASTTHPDAWPVATELLGYRSSLIAPQAPTPGSNTTKLPSSGWTIGPMPIANGAQVHVSLAPPASAKSSFRFERLGENPNANAAQGAAFGFLDGAGKAAIVIDDYWIKNAVIRNATIVYRGGPVRLENVYFVNCRFDFARVPDGRNLAKQLLASASVTFSTQAS